MRNIETIPNPDTELLCPLRTEVRDDSQTMALFDLAITLEKASHEPFAEGRFNPYHKLRDVMFYYVGDPNIKNREGIHELPGVVRETRNGTRNYTLGCAAMFDPETAEMCIVRKDPSVTDWLVISYNIASGELREKKVLGSRIKSGEQGDEITLDLVQEKAYHGPNQLNLSVNQNYTATALPVTLSHKMYYGRGTGPEANSMIDAVYTEDVGLLFEIINFESQLRALETLPENQVMEMNRRRNELHRGIGHIAA